MGIWGVELYQNDISLDVKDQFEDQLRNGRNVKEITIQMVEDFSCLIGNPCEEPLFWFALADTQWNWGMLLPYVKEQALSWIEKGGDIGGLLTESMEIKSQRRKVLDDLRFKLLSPQPPIRKFVKKRLYKCEWNIDDVFAYQLESDLAKDKGLLGRFFLIQKVDEGTWYPGHIVPIVYIKITEDEKLPVNIEEYNQLEYVQTWFTKYEERFFPIDGRRPQEDIAEKSKIHYEVDEFGFLPQFRVRLLNTSRKVIPKKLIYIGNFPNATRPKKEFIPHSKTNIITVSWKNFDETFETKMIKQYCGHNLREYKIYPKSNG